MTADDERARLRTAFMDAFAQSLDRMLEHDDAVPALAAFLADHATIVVRRDSLKMVPDPDVDDTPGMYL